MTRVRRGLGAAVLASLVAVSSATGLAQGVVTRAQSLYTAARYEDVLTLLEGVDTSDRSPFAFDVMRYRALCWLALGQEREAERAIAALVDVDPFYAPDAREVAPRVAKSFAEVRRTRVPSVARSMLVEARRALKRHDGGEADRLLRLAARLLSEPDLGAGPELTDLRMVADALTELSLLQAESASLVSPRTAAGPSQTDRDAPPFPLAQSFPAWEPAGSIVARTDYDGAVRVWVDASGNVTGVAIERATYAPYDRLVLEAAREWRYRPARRGGVQVAEMLVVEYSLRPPLRWQIFRSARGK